MRKKPTASKKKAAPAVGRPALPEGMRKVNFSVSVTPELRDAIGELAMESSISASQWACAALIECVARQMAFAAPTREESIVTAIADTQSVLRTLKGLRNGSR